MSVIQKAVVKGTLASTVQIRNIFFAQVATTSLDTFQILWDGYLNAFYSPLISHLSPLWQLQSVEIYQKETEWVLMDEIVYTKQGTETTTDMLANLVAWVVIGKVSQYRGFGRKFISGLTESQVNGNSIIAGALAGMAATALAYVSVYFGENSGVLGPGIVDKTGAFRAFNLGLVSPLLGTMRRRKPGLGI